MERIDTREGLIRRTITISGGRFLNFYNSPGEEQPINSDMEEHADAAASNAQAAPRVAKDNA